MFGFIRKYVTKIACQVLADLDKERERNSGFITTTGSQLHDMYLFDWLGQAYNGGWRSTAINPNNASGEPDSGYSKNVIPVKIKIKPIDVVDELEKVPTPFNVEMIDEKISVLEDKRDLLIQEYAKRDVGGMIERLENRKKYPEYRDFFERFSNTTDEKIEKLTDKYELVMRTADIFIPEFPDDAVKVMKEYAEKVDELCGKKIVFYVIATADLFKKVDGRRDPILLAQSPFGFFYQILGAWDKEMLILSEL